MTLDVPSLRSDTPGVANVLHFNNAGSALPPRPVLDAVTSHLAREAAIGGYEAAAEAADRIADVYDAVATLIGARPDRNSTPLNSTPPIISYALFFFLTKNNKPVPPNPSPPRARPHPNSTLL